MFCLLYFQALSQIDSRGDFYRLLDFLDVIGARAGNQKFITVVVTIIAIRIFQIYLVKIGTTLALCILVKIKNNVLDYIANNAAFSTKELNLDDIITLEQNLLCFT